MTKRNADPDRSRMAISRRPFYTEYAWAFDLIVDRPVRKECAAIVLWLIDYGVVPGSSILDAGCGTGRYASELARRGYRVDGVDASEALIEQARRAAGGLSGSVSFAVADIVNLPPARYDAVLCRGVLNDLVGDEERDAAFAAFRRSVRSDGLLVLDVREWRATAERKVREPLFRKRVATERGTLTFTSTTELDIANRRLIVREQHQLAGAAGTVASDWVFLMRCWTQAELSSTLARHGFQPLAYYGAFDQAVAAGSTDRLVALARCSDEVRGR